MKNIVETAIAAGNFKTLVEAVKAAGLVEALSGPGPFTVFAPQDSAFAALPAGTVEGLLKDKAKLAEILKYHVVSGKYDLSQLRERSGMQSEMTKLKTLQGKELKISSAKATAGSDEIETVMLESSVVIKPDILCSNGICHMIDRVLIPK
ncbi:MAG: Fasciclin domain protein [Candidatus Methanofastidiosum methylothiophilum]|uniref:Fasciclin domain protein n=1 Tax=Candidatus Methanofastidiosum methylothiophilum TaxID=1705564 RepID=A0A150ILY5_9EURY|nr:MAG: Fasciclin domain protein [Candidatus Methanofastidiosum methylthiophilus]KYC48181.1 MAG: Fasciclin domain protein [Candidatus Methanofastidiosum methylthiophilus]KYC50836.1 MAG: Fasciclin domain protein [Candidatus Methanofastidiosum methylthiophilus]